MRKISEKKKQAIQNKVAEVTDKQPSKTDPLGSYTGMPENPYKKERAGLFLFFAENKGKGEGTRSRTFGKHGGKPPYPLTGTG